MGDKPPFDLRRASFLLVAAVIAVYCLVVLAGVAFCWMHPEADHMERCSRLGTQLIEMLAAALASALAFAGGMGKDK